MYIWSLVYGWMFISKLYGNVVNIKSNRVDIIDLLRGIAILLVVIRHVQLRISFEQADYLMNLPEYLFNAIFVSGNEGVRIFFVISGFLITMTSLHRYSDLNKINIKEFYKFRFARIAPCLIGLLTILTVLHFSGVKDYVINAKFSYGETLFSALTFHVNWLEGVKGYLPGSWDILWSLSVEEVFYIAFPLVCFISRSKRVLYAILITLIMIGPFYRFLLEGDKIWQSKAYLSCMDAIALGCLVALITHKKIIAKHVTTVFFIVGGLIVLFVLMVKRDPNFSVLSEIYVFKSILSIGVALLLVAAVRHELKPVIRKLLSPLIIYGRLSYEVYLTHMFVVYSGVRLYKYYDVGINDSLIWLTGIILVSGMLGYTVERFFSNPMNLLLRKRGGIELPYKNCSRA